MLHFDLFLYFIAILNCFCFSKESSEDEFYKQFTRLNENLLRKWYPNPLDQFILQSKQFDNITDRVLKFQVFYPNVSIHDSIFGTSMAYRIPSTLDNRLLLDMSFYDRQTDIILEKYATSFHLKPIEHLLMSLSKDNRNLIFIGDSLTEQTYQAFQLEAVREGIQLQHFTSDDIAYINRECNDLINCQNGYSSGWIYWGRYYDFPKKFIPPKSSGLINNVSIITLWLADYETEFACKCNHTENVRLESTFSCDKNLRMTLQSILPCFNTKIFKNGSYIIANQGAHMQASHYPKTFTLEFHKRNSYKHFFHYFYDLQMNNSRNIFVYKESVPNYFGRHTTNYSLPKDFIDNNQYKCVPKSYNELVVMDQGSFYLKSSNHSFNISILRNYYFYPFWKQKVSNDRVLKVFDCLHFGIISPLTWFPFFYDLDEIYHNRTSLR